MIALELLGAAWETLTLGELALGGTLLGGGAGSVFVARWVVRALKAGVGALEASTRYVEASTAAARAGARLAPLAAEAMRTYIRHRGGDVPAEVEDDSDQVQILRVAAEGDDIELAHAVEQLARLPSGATLPTSIGRAVRRLVQLEADAQRRRGQRETDAPKPRDRDHERTWLRGPRGS